MPSHALLSLLSSLLGEHTQLVPLSLPKPLPVRQMHPPTPVEGRLGKMQFFHLTNNKGDTLRSMALEKFCPYVQNHKRGDAQSPWMHVEKPTEVTQDRMENDVPAKTLPLTPPCKQPPPRMRPQGTLLSALFWAELRIVVPPPKHVRPVRMSKQISHQKQELGGSEGSSGDWAPRVASAF